MGKEIDRKIEKVTAVLETGFINYIILSEETDSEWENYKQLLEIESDYGYVIAVEFGDGGQKQMTNPIGTGVRLQKSGLLFPKLIKGYFNALVGGPISNRMFAYVPVWKEFLSETEWKKIREKADQMAEEMEKAGNLRVKIGIGDIRPIRSIQVSYKQAMLALKQAERKVVHISEISESYVCEQNYPISVEEEIFLSVKKGDIENIALQCRLFFLWMEEREKMLSDSIRLKCLEFVLRAETIQYFRGGVTYYFDSRKEYLREVTMCKNLEEMKEWFLSKMRQAGNSMWIQKHGAHSEFVRQAESYIREHFQEELSLGEIAEHLHLNAHYLSRLFKEQMRKTLSDFIADVRIEYAEVLLSDEKRTIKEIGAACGYGNPNYFSRLFKKKTKLSPQEYRIKIKRTIYPDGNSNL